MNLILKLLEFLGYLITLVISVKMIRKAIHFAIARSRFINKAVHKARWLFSGLKFQWQTLMQNMSRESFSPPKIVQAIGKGVWFSVALVLSPIAIAVFLLVILLAACWRPHVEHDRGCMVYDI
ncbi:hypothetical protein J4421_06680 [Candidatus Woesearchaeota archaeon]|nr:hypothetical protein [Candidatus Woesearchaeota archaeon]